MQTQKINKFKIEPCQGSGAKKSDFKGSDVFKREFYNAALLSKTASGKSTVLFNLVKKYAVPSSVFFIFCPTYDIDPTWSEIINYLIKHDIPYTAEKHFIEESNNLIDIFMKEHEIINNDELPSSNMDAEDSEAEEEIKKQIEDKQKILVINQLKKACGLECDVVSDDFKPTSNKNKKKLKTVKRLRKILPKFYIIFDDLSRDMRHKSIETLLKRARHYRACVWISTQAIQDLTPPSHSQLYALMLFSGMSDDSLKKLYARFEMWFSYDRFVEIYKKITSTPYTFITMIPSDQELRKNLDERIKLMD